MGRKANSDYNCSTNIKLTSRNATQKKLMRDFYNPNYRIFFTLGCAGSGKTYMTVLRAMQLYTEHKVNKIIISRPSVGADEDLGYLPGGLEDKMYPWVRPIFDVMYEHWMPDKVEQMLEQDVLEIAPLAYLRGRSFSRCAIILDEFQNSTIAQMKMALTRVGQDSYMFVTGDEGQSDLKGQKNGLVDFCERLAITGSDMISVTRFSKSDIVRDPIVEEVLNIYDTTDATDVIEDNKDALSAIKSYEASPDIDPILR